MYRLYLILWSFLLGCCCSNIASRVDKVPIGNLRYPGILAILAVLGLLVELNYRGRK